MNSAILHHFFCASNSNVSFSVFFFFFFFKILFALPARAEFHVDSFDLEEE